MLGRYTNVVVVKLGVMTIKLRMNKIPKDNLLHSLRVPDMHLIIVEAFDVNGRQT